MTKNIYLGCFKSNTPNSQEICLLSSFTRDKSIIVLNYGFFGMFINGLKCPFLVFRSMSSGTQPTAARDTSGISTTNTIKQANVSKVKRNLDTSFPSGKTVSEIIQEQIIEGKEGKAELGHFS